ncbi:MAG: excinuclease ABC subunit UvrA [Lachnospiraceae bacterium]|nr:excinuclease ABC subunit UvrA [Lachnospiraceae bacterium]
MPEKHNQVIKISHAYEGNLKDVSLEIPKNKLVAFTGLSGSGKSTLLIDVLFQECQRQYLEAMSMEGIHKPKVERIQGISPALMIAQTDANRNPRSTVGTMTDVYTDLRMIYEKLGVRRCPHCQAEISAADCKEETEKKGNDFLVYMYCCKCGSKMKKITRTEFSFNTKEGACPVCEGLGKIHRIRKNQVIDEKLSLSEGAVRYWEKQYGKYQISILKTAFAYYGLPFSEKTLVGDFSEIQKVILQEGVADSRVQRAFPGKKAPEKSVDGKFEGVFSILRRRLADKEGDMKRLASYFEAAECPACKGERLSEISRNVVVNGIRLPQLSCFSLERLYDWVCELEQIILQENKAGRELVGAYLLDLKTKLNRFQKAGLGYLTPDRQIITLSGGEMQRLRLAAMLDSDLTGVIYILDEPTAGLHPRDTQGLIDILKKLRDLGNTVLIIEHDPDVMEAADYIVDMGPGAGKYGGEVVAQGTLETIMQQENSLTGEYLRRILPGKLPGKMRISDKHVSNEHKLSETQFASLKTTFRSSKDVFHIKNADRFNLKNIAVDIPIGCMTAVTGPSGSGKSTLVFEVLANEQLEQFDKIIEVEQSAITKMKRSNVATYSGLYAEIRTVFSRTQAAKKAGLTAKYFSFNTPGGRCENCEGLGYVSNNMLFFRDTEIVCPVCQGKQFSDDVLAVLYKGLSIKEVLMLSVEEAADFFADHAKIAGILGILKEAGLGYLELGQTLTTLSGGEGQRLKLARELVESSSLNRKFSKELVESSLDGKSAREPAKRSSGRQCLYLLDEPTTGLHPKDVEHFLKLLNRITDAGNTVVVVEHNQQLIQNCDWEIELGPDGGEKGGEVIYEGRPKSRKMECRWHS